jgi:hypothetical protein
MRVPRSQEPKQVGSSWVEGGGGLGCEGIDVIVANAINRARDRDSGPTHGPLDLLPVGPTLPSCLISLSRLQQSNPETSNEHEDKINRKEERIRERKKRK